jgi:predicted transcriptional regulator
VINEDGQLVGIISERDIIRGISEHADVLVTLPAERLMTRDVRTCSSEDRLIDITDDAPADPAFASRSKWSTSWHRQHRRRR